VKKELPVVGIQAHDIAWQHINGEIRRELQNVFAVLLCKCVAATACHEVSTAPRHHFGRFCEAPASVILRLLELRRPARTLAFLDKVGDPISRHAQARPRIRVGSAANKTWAGRIASSQIRP
jgi:hypothetical protein